jgi:hypothetical protein
MEPTGVDFALMVFKHIGGAEQAYGDAASQASGERWAREIAFVEHHQRDRVVVRGMFAGHYVDADDEGEFIGLKTAEGAVAGAAAGLLFGPAGLAVVTGVFAGDTPAIPPPTTSQRPVRRAPRRGAGGILRRDPHGRDGGRRHNGWGASER